MYVGLFPFRNAINFLAVGHLTPRPHHRYLTISSHMTYPYLFRGMNLQGEELIEAARQCVAEILRDLQPQLAAAHHEA